MMKELILIIILFGQNLVFAQSKSSNKVVPGYEKTQVWLGVKGGVNLSHVTVLERFSVFEPIDGNQDTYKKQYQAFNKVGSQFQFIFQFSYRGIIAHVAPGYKSMLYSYKNNYKWQDQATPSNAYELTYNQTQMVEYAILPISIKYEFLKNDFKPYLHAGVVAGYRIKALKSVQVSGKDQASGGTTEYDRQEITSNATSIFNPWWFAAMGGIGLNYDKLNARFFIEANYLYGFNNISNAEKRYTENQFAGSGDVLDNVSLSNLDINIGVLFPMKFLNRGAYIPVKPR